MIISFMLILMMIGMLILQLLGAALLEGPCGIIDARGKLENACSFVVRKCLCLRWPDAVKQVTSGLMTVELAYLL
jgi:hypothetical protein